ncbi:hypothetical protein HXX76_003188 [Chlamydomonas incerta]|uniref:Nudix hydrolase domain-containing protein n=1 Tax=Chlamydomonas incerta TaxID=51695 RepID=A0A835W5Q0_CHLIN|nr:hypothetical protein HXX76_003188 [Chlamydomonas incerta]|eukprot:KAG2441567.1 hypothetical protein HXX76_003188 [Chlamydomonas incerta]
MTSSPAIGGASTSVPASGVAPPSTPRPAAAAPSTAAGAATAAGSGTSTTDVLAPEAHPWHERFDVLDDRMIHKRYMAMYDRTVQFTSDDGQSHTVQYDVVGNPRMDFRFSVAFPFHPATATTPAQVTVVREYAQGPNALQFTLPCGGFDPKKHTTLRDCAIAEMSEEAMLVGGEIVDLLPEDHPGQSELKWSRNKFKPFLFIDPQPDPSGHAARDAEEHTIEVMRVTIPELYGIILGGQMMLPSVFAAFAALEALKSRKLI